MIAVVFLVAAVVGGKHGGAPSGTPAPVSGGAPKGEAPASQTASRLGYPAFATKNTTRVGGSDPASNAAGVALATYPSTTPAQRPAAVTLVGEDDWQAAIAASVLMAAPVGAPILFSTADGLPEPSANAFAALDPQGADATAGAQAFLVGDAPEPGGIEGGAGERGERRPRSPSGSPRCASG